MHILRVGVMDIDGVHLSIKFEKQELIMDMHLIQSTFNKITIYLGLFMIVLNPNLHCVLLNVCQCPSPIRSLIKS